MEVTQKKRIVKLNSLNAKQAYLYFLELFAAALCSSEKKLFCEKYFSQPHAKNQS